MLDNLEEMKRKPVELNLAAAKKRKSAQTGFVHYCHASLPGERHDTIPLYENFCYALGLLRSRTSEHVLEAKSLLEKLAAFEAGGNFPIYLHEYPECKDRSLSLHILPILFWTLRDFRLVLGEALCTQLEELVERILLHAERVHGERPLSAAAWNKWKAYASPDQIADQVFTTAEDWAHYLIALQIAHVKGSDISNALATVGGRWHSHLHAFLGPNLQEGTEPEVTLFDLFLGHSQHSYAARALVDHPIHLQASLVHPIQSVHSAKTGSFEQVITDDSRQGYVAFWGDGKMTHSLCCDHRKSVMKADLMENGAELLFTLPEGWEPSEQPEMPLSLFCNLSDVHALFINGQKATAFQLGDLIEISTEGRRIGITFSCVEGEGVFFGHLLRANRPTQQSCAGPHRFDAHDWLLAIRTVRRSSHVALKIKIGLDQD
jgi:hypothetical protein